MFKSKSRDGNCSRSFLAEVVGLSSLLVSEVSGLAAVFIRRFTRGGLLIFDMRLVDCFSSTSGTSTSSNCNDLHSSEPHLKYYASLTYDERELRWRLRGFFTRLHTVAVRMTKRDDIAELQFVRIFHLRRTNIS